MKKESRRKALKKLSLTAASLPFLGRDLFSGKSQSRQWGALPRIGNPGLRRPVTAITLGAGSRGNVYGDYGVEYPDELDIVGVAEPIPIRRERYAQKHDIPEKQCFVTWEHVFQQPKFADTVIISTPDDLHFEPCMQALEMGYDILLEKPIAPTEEECRQILAKAQETGRIVAVCHVLRYAPYFIGLREMIRNGAIGELISLQHLEPIQHRHMAHSYVRGNWHRSEQTTPIILAKSCHDLDILRWLTGRPCRSISAFGSLKWFREENAPKGSTERCMDGCAVEGQCPYSALKIYHRRGDYLYVFDLPEDPEQRKAAILEQLRTTDYGRCVYRMDNDQPDHYVTAIEFEGGITASFSMEAFTAYHGRRTRVMGSMGDLVGDMNTFTHHDFLTDKAEEWTIRAEDVEHYKNSGHGGGDWALVTDWVRAVAEQEPAHLTSTIEVSVESHLMAFAAEKSRLGGKVVSLT